MMKWFSIGLAISGWLLALLLAWHGRHQILSQFRKGGSKPTIQERVEERQYHILHSMWHDPRPTTYFLGDSQIEMGNWYELFEGQFSVPNCGISGSKIPDAIRIAETLPPEGPAGIVILCGINDLAAGRSIDHCMNNFKRLFELLIRRNPRLPVHVISVFPAGRPLGNLSISEVNRKVIRLNELLQKEASLCHFSFVDVFSELEESGMLRKSLTSDGLHLNQKGYQVVASQLRNSIAMAQTKRLGNSNQ